MWKNRIIMHDSINATYTDLVVFPVLEIILQSYYIKRDTR